MKRVCPDCRVEGVRSLLRLSAGPWRTDWYGILRYWRCRMGHGQYVTTGNGSAEPAI